MRNIDLKQMPFSRRGSYMVISELAEDYQSYQNPAGYYIRTIHQSTLSPLVAKMTLRIAGAEAQFASSLSQAALVFSSGEKKIGCCFADDVTLLIKGDAETGIGLDFLTESGPYDYICEITENGQTLYIANCFKNNNRYLICMQEGNCLLEQQWEESSSLYSRLSISGENGFLCVIKEINTEWDKKLTTYSYEDACRATEEGFLDFYAKTPRLSAQYEDMGYMAAYLNWSSIVRPMGFLKREAMYMSKNWMTNVWSWDHCFNAIALSYANPKLAWDTYMIMADFQDKTGRLPDSISDEHIIWNYCKPPVHGWALKKMLENMEPSDERLEEAYAFLEKWTDWWMRYRKWNGLFYYNHGNDSGWDNATAFSVQPPVATPELQADMIVQMNVLSDLAERLNKKEDAARWKKSAGEHLGLFLCKCFRNNLPVAIQCSSGKVVENQSLLPYEILILGTELPEAIRKAVMDVLKGDTFQTAYGYATESPHSGLYRENGYWRGPIWAPSTLLLVDGMKACGEKELAVSTARKFVDMVCKSGFAENFNALTGEGLCDRAYTWTSSVAVILAKEYLS